MQQRREGVVAGEGVCLMVSRYTYGFTGACSMGLGCLGRCRCRWCRRRVNLCGHANVRRAAHQVDRDRNREFE
jgi:hypothetical protein